MPRKTRRVRLPPEQFAVDHPFVIWYAGYHSRGAAECADRAEKAGGPAGDVFMGELAARRFSIGLDDDKVPVLGIAEDDAAPVMSVPWSAAAFLRQVPGRSEGKTRRRDWIALNCSDARIEGSGTLAPVQIRLWLPVTDGLLDGWAGLANPPTTLRVIEAYIRRGKPQPKPGASPLALLPLALKGSWERPAADKAKTDGAPPPRPPAADSSDGGSP